VLKLPGQTGWRQAAWVLGDQAVSSATSFAVSLLLGRLVAGEASRATLGEYSLALSVFGFALLFQQDLLCLPFTVLRAGQRPRRERFFAGSIFTLQVLLSLVGACLAGVIALAVAWWRPSELVYSLLALALAMPLMLLREFLRRYCLAVHNARAAALWDALAFTLVVATLLILWQLRWLTSWTTLASLGAVNLIVASLWLARVWPQWRFGSRRQLLRDAARSWDFSSWNLASGILACAPTFVLPWILAANAGKAEAGVFAACVALVGFPTVLLAGLQNYLIPRAAARFAQAGLRGLYAEITYGTLALNSIATAFLLLVILTGDGLARVIFSSAYAGSGGVLLALAGALWFHSINAAFTSFLQAVHKSRANVLPNLADLVITLGLLAWLAPQWGATGAALARLAGAVAATALRGIALRNVLAPASAGAPSLEATPA
jgi:O-antigen/teichoic acid export membrane protein